MSKNSIVKFCCTCLSTDRKVHQLCKILDGINILYMLLSLDAEAYKQGFYREPSSLLVCWECVANIDKIKRFRKQVCTAQKLLTSIDEERNVSLHSLSHLKITQNTYVEQIDCTLLSTEENFIDCGPIIKEIKSESEDEIPLSMFCNNANVDEELIHTAADDDDLNENIIETPESFISFDDKINLLPQDLVKRQSDTEINNAVLSKKVNNNIQLDKSNINVTNANEFMKKQRCAENLSICYNSIVLSKNTISIKSGKINKKPDKTTTDLDKINEQIQNNSTNKIKISKKQTNFSKYFSMSTMTKEEMLISVEKRKKDLKKDTFKCDKCLITFKNEEEVLKHIERLHVKQNKLSECDICHSYIEDLPTHTQSHYSVYVCVLCTHKTNTRTDIVRHLKGEHYEICCKRKKGSREGKYASLEARTYPCSECDLFFRNKDLRWKHVQKSHREGFQCNTCSKKFAFKSNLERHQRSHGPVRRRECPVCHKAVRVDLWSTHAHTHTDRQKHTCVECDKVFVSEATYRTHLKYARAHATQDVRRHACTCCDKRFRSGGELADHVTYSHEGRATHRCPVCDKGLATARCVRRHVRRAHDGIKEGAKDKVCQVCGRTFRDKKTLLEHERVHSGARPLACAVCARTFRQRAALYKHTQRLHHKLNT